MPLWAQILIAVLASSVLATGLGKLLDIWLYKIKHKDDVDETNNALENKVDTLTDEVKGLRLDVKRLADVTDNIRINTLSETYISIRRDASTFIKRGKISISDKNRLHDRYAKYNRLPGADNGLKYFISAVDDCQIITEDN